jgi:hypothetical protein
MERRSEDLSARQPVGDRQTGTVPAESCPISVSDSEVFVTDPDSWIRHLEI